MDDSGDVSEGSDPGDHSPETPGSAMPRTRNWDAPFFAIAVITALALVAIIFFLRP